MTPLAPKSPVRKWQQTMPRTLRVISLLSKACWFLCCNASSHQYLVMLRLIVFFWCIVSSLSSDENATKLSSDASSHRCLTYFVSSSCCNASSHSCVAMLRPLVLWCFAPFSRDRMQLYSCALSSKKWTTRFIHTISDSPVTRLRICRLSQHWTCVMFIATRAGGAICQNFVPGPCQKKERKFRVHSQQEESQKFCCASQSFSVLIWFLDGRSFHDSLCVNRKSKA